MTLILVVTLITFVIYRFIDMRQGPIIVETIEEDHFDIDTIFKSDEEDFKFAFGLL